MASIFRKDDNFVDKPNRNSFDLSFQNNLTTKFGVLKPVYCQEVLPGDSMKIRPDFALRFLPLVFPVQTRMRAHLHFFYVRNRTIWKDWMDFIGKTKEGLVSPYMNFTNSNRDMLKVGGIADMFGLPVVLNSQNWVSLSYSNRDSNQRQLYYDFETKKYYDGLYPFFNFAETTNFGLIDKIAYYPTPNRAQDILIFPDYNLPLKAKDEFEFVYSSQADCFGALIFELKFEDGEKEYVYKHFKIDTGDHRDGLIELTDDEFDYAVSIKPVAVIASVNQSDFTFTYDVRPSDQPDGIPLSSLSIENIQKFVGAVNGEPISALPFRAYEAIYNSFYRNAENNPYILNGVPEYNKYIPTYDGGADSNNYDYHNRNWEDDFLTTALQTPQQGNAPLVGPVTQQPNTDYWVTFAMDDGTTNRVRLATDSQNRVYLAANTSEQTPDNAVVGEFNEAMMEAVKFGISINDFRNVNSFQRWLENNVRKGYKYRDQIKGHYGVSVRYDELDMPEFIGGVSRDVSVQQITQTVKNEFGELGEFGGNSYVMGSGETINQYCDEHGFIIGILSVVPMANYSQVIPKYLIKRDALDYYFPEFGKIGMQPIQNKEVTFLESIDEGKKDEIFGYQRAWYDYLARTDEVHGLFRTNLRDFLVGRTFDSLPSLSAQFSTIDNEQLNNIFYVDDNEDKILGQIFFDVTGIRPIPVYGIPSIE